MESQFVQLVLSQTGMGGIALISLWLLNKAYADALRREREYAESIRALYADQNTTTKELIRTLTELRGAIEDVVHVNRKSN